MALSSILQNVQSSQKQVKIGPRKQNIVPYCNTLFPQNLCQSTEKEAVK